MDKSIEETPAVSDIEKIVALLNQPLDSKRVKYREAPGSDPVPYIEGYDAINTANEIFGYRWSSKIIDVHIERWERPVIQWNSQTRKKEPVLDNDGNQTLEPVGLVYVTGEVSATMGNEYYTKGDIGVNTISGLSPESLDTAIKGAATDLLKRCLRQFGEQFGNSLYDKEVREELKEELRPSVSRNGGGQRPNAPRPTNGGSASNTTRVASKDTNGGSAASPTPEQVEAAKNVVLPPGLPFAGKTIGEAVLDKDMGMKVVKYYTGTVVRESTKQKFVPTNDEEKRLQEAASLVISQIG